jgi:multiple sugar transport system permease protein
MGKYGSKKLSDKISQICIWAVLLIMLVILSLPYLFMVSNSFEEFSYSLPFPPRLIPKEFLLDAYTYILQLDIFPVCYKNSIIIAFSTVFFEVVIASLSAYGFARIKFPGRELLFKIYLFTLMVPGFLNIIPQFITLGGIKLPFGVYKDGLIGTRAGLVLVYVATGICGYTFFLRNFFKGLPDALSESVIIDGGSHMTIYRKIMLPLSKPALATMAIFALQGIWEEFFTANILIGANESMITLPILLQRLNSQHATRWEWVFAASILVQIPVIALYIIFQKKAVVGGLSDGSVKQ